MSVFKQGTVFAGRYFLEELIGEGGFSEVWRVHDRMADKAIGAVKIYAPEKGLDDYGIRQFRQEYSITHSLSHSHLMKVYYFDIADGSPFLIMPYYQQGSLARQLQDKGVFSEKQIALLMCQMGSALMELHQQQPPVLHQDIKPDNILVSKTDHFILTDFGISSNTRQTLRKSTTKFKPLTIGYAPPERFDRNPVSNTAGDIFSLGVTLYEMCTGQIPWDGNGGQSLLKGAHIPALPVKFPKELNRMLEACMAADWTKRPSADQVMNWGKFYIENGFWKFENSKKGLKTPVRNKEKYLIPVGAIGVVALAATLWLRSSGEQPSPDKPQKIVPVQQASITGVTSEKRGNTSPIYESKKVDDLKNTKKEVNPPKKVPITKADKPINKPIPDLNKTNLFITKSYLENYLNNISNSKLTRKERKDLKNIALIQFINPDVQVINEKDGLGDSNTAKALLDILLEFPHQVKVIDISVGFDKDKQQKIDKLVVELEPLKF